MLAKILIFLGSLVAVYIASKRHKIFAHLMSRVGDNLGAREPASKSEKPDAPTTAGTETDQIEELDYDPETGRYSVRKNRRNRNS